MPLQSFTVLDLFETDPPPDREERKRLADIVRDEIEALQRTTARAATTGAEAARELQRVFDPKATPREREVLMWFRGSSLTFTFQPTDTAWAEDLWTTLRHTARTLRFRPIDAVQAKRDARAKGCTVKCTVAVSPAEGDLHPEDWIAEGARSRNFGGQDGRSRFAAFGVRAFYRPQERAEAEASEVVLTETPDDEEPFA